MMNRLVKYEFSAEVWQHSSPGGWYFVILPEELAVQITEIHKAEEQGWGRLKVVSRIGSIEWQTPLCDLIYYYTVSYNTFSKILVRYSV